MKKLLLISFCLFSSLNLFSQTDKTGIFLVDNEKETKILPSVFTGTQTRSLAAGLTYGIASGKIKSTIRGVSSANVVTTREPVFHFYFSDFKENLHHYNDWWFRYAQSPNEFVLVKLQTKKSKNIRLLETGKANLWVGTDIGINDKSAIKFVIEQSDDKTFKLSFTQPLQPGEYCFFYQGAIPQGGYNNQSIFDFSIQ